MVELLPILRLILALLLYAFLGVVFYAMWRELHEHAQREPEQRPAATLLISTESQPDERFRLRPVTASTRGPIGLRVFSGMFLVQTRQPTLHRLSCQGQPPDA